MTKNPEPEFTVTDRRRFSSEGEASQEQEQPQREWPKEHEEPAATQAARSVLDTPAGAAPPQPSAEMSGSAESEAPEYEAPTMEERRAQEDAFKASTLQLDKELESALGGRRAQDFQMTFERFVASIYMSALMQLGLMREQGGPAPPVDLVGARQTIDTLSLLSEKTKGNLTMQEENLLQNSLYELRMAYVEVTNAITRAPQPGAGGPGGRK